MRGRISLTAEFAVENPSSIREIMNLVADYRRHPERYPRPLIYMGGGWPQDPPPEFLREGISAVLEDDGELVNSARYPPTRGDPEFLEAIAKYESIVFGREIETEELLSGLGSTDISGGLFLATLDRGSEVIMATPFYLNYERQILVESGMGARIRRWRTIKGGKFNPDLGDLDELITPDTRMIVITTPGNPDGQVYDDETLSGVVDIAEDRGLWVLIDVAYRMFHYGDIPAYYSRKRRENELWLASLSKEFRIPGWRAAYLYGDPYLLRAVETVQQARTLSPSGLIQRGFVKMMENTSGSRIKRYMLSETPSLYGRTAARAYDGIARIEKLRPLRPDGGFYVFFNIGETGKTSKEFTEELLRGWQVALAPGVDFGMEGWVRLSFAPLVMNEGRLREGLDRISRYVSSIRD